MGAKHSCQTQLGSFPYFLCFSYTLLTLLNSQSPALLQSALHHILKKAASANIFCSAAEAPSTWQFVYDLGVKTDL